jgi:hypothetical protein
MINLTELNKIQKRHPRLYKRMFNVIWEVAYAQAKQQVKNEMLAIANGYQDLLPSRN